MEREIINWLEGRCDSKEFRSRFGMGELTVLLLYGSRMPREDFYGAVSEAPLDSLANAEFPSGGVCSWVQTREGWVVVLLARADVAQVGSLLRGLLAGEENFIVTNDLDSARIQYAMLREKRMHLPPPQKLLVAEVCRYIEEHLDDVEISLSNVAEQFFISEGYLS